MSDKFKCPECQSKLKMWDFARHTETKMTALDSTVGQMGLWGFIVSLFGSWFVYKADEHESTVWKCTACDKKFTGEKLKPYEWSDYE